jgi:hypothetical protein
MPDAPTLAVVVPAGDSPPTLERCLEAIAGSERAPDEVIVQREPGAAGPAAVRNAAAARTGADVLVFVDSDVEVHPDALTRIERHFAESPGLGGVFGAYDADPSDPGLTSRFRNLLHHHVHRRAAGEAETFWAGLGAVRRTTFDAVGGFDAESYPRPSIEDIELGMRLRDRGARIVLDPEIRGRHLKRWTPVSMVRTDFADRGVPWARLLLRRRGSSAALNLGARHRLSAAAALIAVAAAGARRPRAGMLAILAVVLLNRDLYGLLARRGGPRLAVAGFGLHIVHHLTAAAALPAALLAHLREEWRR